MSERIRHVIARENNVVRVDFGREPDPPQPTFPGAGALRHDPGDDHSPTHDLAATCRDWRQMCDAPGANVISTAARIAAARLRHARSR